MPTRASRIYQHLSDADWVTGDMVPQSGAARRRAEIMTAAFSYLQMIIQMQGTTMQTALTSATRRCYLGGADSLWGGFVANDTRGGRWLPWPGAVSPLVTAKRGAIGDAGYLFPITRELNPNFKGVIFVQGKVVISGTVRGKITIAATDDIIIGDDLVYASDPGAGTCADMVGIFSGDDVVIADNPINNAAMPYSYQSYRTYDETTAEFIHGVILALNIFTVENYDQGSSSAQPCEGQSAGRGCII